VSSGPSYSSGGISLSTVGGITVNSQIAGQLRSMLSAASASGVHLSGGGYRDPCTVVIPDETRSLNSSRHSIDVPEFAPPSRLHQRLGPPIRRESAFNR